MPKDLFELKGLHGGQDGQPLLPGRPEELWGVRPMEFLPAPSPPWWARKPGHATASISSPTPAFTNSFRAGYDEKPFRPSFQP